MRRVAAAVAFACLFSGAAHAHDARAIVRETAERQGAPPALALGIAQTESGFRCHVRGRASERGVMQVKPATARQVGVFGNLYNCQVGAEAGVRYLKLALARAGGDWGIAASLYNRGISASHIMTGYARRVLSNSVGVLIGGQ